MNQRMKKTIVEKCYLDSPAISMCYKLCSFCMWCGPSHENRVAQMGLLYAA